MPHHHGDYESIIYLLTGAARIEFGPGGSQAVDTKPGDFIFVPGGAIHREGNISDEEGTAIVVRSGSRPPVTNVEGPEPS